MSSPLAERLRYKYYRHYIHPNRQLRNHVETLLRPGMALLDAGCGREAPALRHFVGKAERLVGIDLVDPRNVPAEIQYFKRDLTDTGLPDASIDLVYSQSVFEHLEDPGAVMREIRRVLRPNGRLVVLTPSKWDYGSIVAMMIPNKFHPAVVEHVEGRDRENTFPTYYRCNTESAIRSYGAATGLDVEEIQFLNQYPNYLLFNGPLFLLGMVYERLTTRLYLLRRLRGWILFTLIRR